MVSFDSSQDVIARIKDQADLVRIIGESVNLKKSGARYLGCCPFHGEKTPSFSVHPGKQFFYCFGCGESGDVFDFMMKYHHLDFPAALKDLAGRLQIPLPERSLSPQAKKKAEQRKRLLVLNKRVAVLYREVLLQSQEAGAARDYLKNRQIGSEPQETFQIGYAPSVEQSGWHFLGTRLSKSELKDAEEVGLVVKNDRGGYYDRFRDRIMFPIFDIRGKVIGFGGRIVGEGQPKYMNSPESLVFNKSTALFGFFQTMSAVRKGKRAILVEGNFDLVSLVAGGCTNVVAPLGTALTRGQLALLKRSCPEGVLLFDGDKAGIKAAVRAVPLFLAEELSGRVALLPEGHDPDTFIREKGLQELNTLIEGASPLPEFAFEQLVANHGLTLDGKRKIVAELTPLVNAAPSTLQQTVVVAHFAEKLGLPPEELKGMLTVSSEPVPQMVPEEQQPYPGEEGLRPLTPAQNYLVRFMVFNPTDFETLDQAGIRNCLGGTVGEILYLQMKAMLNEGRQVQPEELLTALPVGAERQFVKELLINAAPLEDPAELTDLSGDNKNEMSELLEWIKRDALKRQSAGLMAKIEESQANGDVKSLTKYMAEKVEIERELQGLSG